MAKLETTSGRCRSGSRCHLTRYSSASDASSQGGKMWEIDGFQCLTTAWRETTYSVRCTLSAISCMFNLPLRLLYGYYRLGIWKNHRRTKFSFKAPKGCARLLCWYKTIRNMPYSQAKCFIYLHINTLQPSV